MKPARRLVAINLVLVLILTLLPIGVLAANEPIIADTPKSYNVTGGDQTTSFDVTPTDAKWYFFKIDTPTGDDILKLYHSSDELSSITHDSSDWEKKDITISRPLSSGQTYTIAHTTGEYIESSETLNYTLSVTARDIVALSAGSNGVVVSDGKAYLSYTPTQAGLYEFKSTDAWWYAVYTEDMGYTRSFRTDDGIIASLSASKYYIVVNFDVDNGSSYVTVDEPSLATLTLDAPVSISVDDVHSGIAKFTALADGDYTFIATPNTYIRHMTLYDNEWTEIGIDDGGDYKHWKTEAVMIIRTLTAGVYYVEINSGSSQLVVSKAGAPSVTGVTAFPDLVEVQTGGTQQFGAIVSGENNPAQTVTWSVSDNSSADTEVNGDGLLTVGADEASETLTITATSTVDITKSCSIIVTVTTVAPTITYGISLDVSAYTFPSVKVGYGTQAPLIVTIMNTGNQETGSLNIVVSGTDKDAFTLPFQGFWNISVGDSDTFTVLPERRLVAGNYTATISVSGENGITASFDVSFTVAAAPIANYTITFNANGGTVATASAVTGVDGKLTSLPIPTRSGYNFQGWFTAASGGSKIATTTLFVADGTVYAQWASAGSSSIPSDGNSSNNNNSGAGTPSTPLTNTVGGSEVTTPAGKNPLANDDGSVTLPGGGMIIAGGDQNITINAPEGTNINKDGDVTIPENTTAEVSTPDVVMMLPGNSQIDGDGKITVGNGSADVMLPGGTQLVLPEGSIIDGKQVTIGVGGAIIIAGENIIQVDEGEIIILDEETPMGYFASYGNPFTDITGGLWYYEAVKYVYQHGIMQGTGNGQFEPNAHLNRAMLVQMLYNLSGKSSAGNAGFDDVTTSAWYSDAIAWAAGNQIVNGVGNNQFAPNAEITREQMAVMLYNYCVFAGIELPVVQENASFVDASTASSWASEAIQAMYQAGILSGKGNGAFDPKGTATRAEVAQMFTNFMISIQ